ncbi:MAG TPA: hypothetical protein HPP97_03255 [Desulfuromonadales bacterium]|nr:hypothetical protein [Desulfuromonadales bacterium]
MPPLPHRLMPCLPVQLSQNTVGAGTAITPNDIFALNTGYSPYKVVGFDAASNSSVTMTGKVKTALEVVR